MNQQEWRDAFKKANGREPSLEEFKQAKAKSFALGNSAESAQNELKNWVRQFESDYNRKPSLQEVKERRFIPANDGQTVQGTSASNQSSAARAQGATPHRQRKNGKKKHRSIWALVIVLVLLIAGFLFGQNYYSYDASMDRAASMLKRHNLDQYSHQIVWSDSKDTLSGSEATPIANWMSEGFTKQSIKKLLANNNYGLTLQKTGTKFFFFNDYKVVATPVTMKISTSDSGLTVKVNDKVVDNDSDEDSDITVKHQAPGLYDITATGTSDGDKVKANYRNILGYERVVDIDLNAKKLSSSSSSSKSKLSKDEASTLIQSMADLMSAKGASSNSDYNSSVDADDVFVDGSDNKAYTDFSQMIDNNKTKSKRVADSVAFNSPDVQDVSSTGQNKADVTFKISEVFHYTEDTDPDNHTSGDLTQVYLLKAHVKYDKDSSKWLIDSIDSDQKKLSEQDNTK
ncbi:hypothetical protein [Fructobacillus papyrifericola]|uniref:Uncharacterized protein n=1 Tax=Fructobacillus papyrifericola TaxID=2713172 RepID=A0ABS5QUD5_9LACO|nr:hypothetical protein [Fructobacillus papyrifericola]MBS9336805.1 hypothetical protein [Fructobacillus papyrifericola]